MVILNNTSIGRKTNDSSSTMRSILTSPAGDDGDGDVDGSYSQEGHQRVSYGSFDYVLHDDDRDKEEEEKNSKSSYAKRHDKYQQCKSNGDSQQLDAEWGSAADSEAAGFSLPDLSDSEAGSGIYDDTITSLSQTIQQSNSGTTKLKSALQNWNKNGNVNKENHHTRKSRRVSFHPTTTTGKTSNSLKQNRRRLSRCPEFRQQWKQKSTRRISAILESQQQPEQHQQQEEQLQAYKDQFQPEPPTLIGEENLFQAAKFLEGSREHNSVLSPIQQEELQQLYDNPHPESMTSLVSGGSSMGSCPSSSSSKQRIETVIPKVQPTCQAKRKKTAQEHWALLREHVKSGKFFLDQSSSDAYAGYTSTRPSYLRKRHTSIVQALQNEIRRGLELSTGTCLKAIGLYLAVAVLCFSVILPETRHQWSAIDSMYFAVVTFTTIGFGDLTPPDTHVARVVTCIFAFLGVACLGLALGVLGHRVVELQSSAMDRVEDNVMNLFAMAPADDSMNVDMMDEDESSEELEQKNLNESQGGNDQHHGDKEGFFLSIWKRCWNKPCGCLGNSSSATPVSVSRLKSYLASKGHRSAKAQQLKRHHSKWIQVLANTNIQFFSFLILLTCLSYWIGEDAGWDFSETLYFAITTSATIGYGDKVPLSQTGRLLVVIFVPFAVAAMGFFLQRLAELSLQARQQEKMTRLFLGSNDKCPTGSTCQKRELTVMDLAAMDADGDGNVSWSEFLEFMLVAMNKIDDDLLWELRYQFDTLDVDDTGVLSKQNLICMARQKLKAPKQKLTLQQYKQHLLHLSVQKDSTQVS